MVVALRRGPDLTSTNMSLEERLAAFRRTHKPPPELTRQRPTTPETPSSPGKKLTPAESIQTNYLPRPSGPVRTVGEVEDTLYNDFVTTDKKIVGLYTFTYVALFAAAIFVEMGAVYFIVSTLYIIWRFGLRQRQRNEASAYSVFNPGLAPIQGSQLTGEQLQRNMGIR